MTNKYLEKIAGWGSYVVGGGKKLGKVMAKGEGALAKNNANFGKKFSNASSGVDAHNAAHVAGERHDKIVGIMSKAKADNAKAKTVKKAVGAAGAGAVAGGLAASN